MTSRIRLVLVDTNVLFPVRLADLVLSSAADGLFDLCVSDDLLDEIERVLVARKGLEADKAGVFREQVEAVACRAIRRAQYRPLAAKLSGPDPDDLLHLAAAVESGADAVMTWNLADFAGVKFPTVASQVEIETPDETFVGLIGERLGEDLVETVIRMSARLNRPPLGPVEVLDALAAAGMERTVAWLRRQEPFGVEA